MAGHPDKPKIWHISADFPDPVEPQKTQVIRQLVSLTSAEVNHFVISINREKPSFGKVLPMLRDQSDMISHFLQFEAGVALSYRAPGKGFFHETMLRRLGEELAARLKNEPKPDLIIGHKLTIEGIVAERLAAHFKVPFALSIQGDTDTKILAARPDLLSSFSRIFHQAETVFPFAPWALRKIERKLGERKGRTILLPCPSDLDEPMEPRERGDKFISAFHLQNFKRKNLRGMVRAMNSETMQGSGIELEIVGGGPPQFVAACRQLATSVPQISFAGPLGRDAIRERLNRAIGFVMPSHRESFGLVFVEALFAGIPIIYPWGQSLDGYLDELPFAIAVDPSATGQIAEAMIHIKDNEADLKRELRSWQRSKVAEQFRRPAIAETFGSGIRESLG
ncbi:glycosyltransferase [Erythrobacter sp. HA6-11]